MWKLTRGSFNAMCLASLISIAGVARCDAQTAPTDQTPDRADAQTERVINQGGAGPAPGRTPAERQARKDYYGGPRGDEF